MKKIILILTVVFTSSCSTTYYSKHQAQTMRKFEKVKHTYSLSKRSTLRPVTFKK